MQNMNALLLSDAKDHTKSAEQAPCMWHSADCQELDHVTGPATLSDFIVLLRYCLQCSVLASLSLYKEEMCCA